jgi:hypothetical protein
LAFNSKTYRFGRQIAEIFSQKGADHPLHMDIEGLCSVINIWGDLLSGNTETTLEARSARKQQSELALSDAREAFGKTRWHFNAALAESRAFRVKR